MDAGPVRRRACHLLISLRRDQITLLGRSGKWARVTSHGIPGIRSSSTDRQSNSESIGYKLSLNSKQSNQQLMRIATSRDWGDSFTFPAKNITVAANKVFLASLFWFKPQRSLITNITFKTMLSFKYPFDCRSMLFVLWIRLCQIASPNVPQNDRLDLERGLTSG